MRLKSVLWATCAPILVSVFAFVDAAPALAQKSKDMMRIAFYQPVRLVDTYYEGGPEGTVANRMVFDNLVNYDNDKNEFVPGVAASWKQIDPLTMELKLASGLTFSDGQPVTMDDIEYTFQFMMDATAKYRFQDTRIGWFDKFERVDATTFRLKSKEPVAVFLAKLTQFPAVIPKHVHSKLEKREFFGNKPVGSGPYVVTKIDDQTGITMERFAGYKHGNVGKPAGQVKYIQVDPVFDAQTQTARMIRGDQDIMYSIDRDLADNFGKDPKFQVHVADSVSFNFLKLDVKARSGNKIFTDKRMRQAVMHAIDRSNLRGLLHPAVAKMPSLATVCSPLIKYCDSSSPLPEYDPEKAKKLMAEAGYGNGFDMPILTWGEGRDAAEAVSGMWRKVGIRASVETAPFPVFIKKRIDGVPAIVTLWDNSVGQPDLDNTAEYYFLPNARNYNEDKDLLRMSYEARSELDEKKRAAIYKALFNKSNEEAYLMPLNRIPAMVLAQKDVELLGGHKHPYGFELNRVKFK
jgi:peptide/nickel transport system substrate-binding protein